MQHILPQSSPGTARNPAELIDMVRRGLPRRAVDEVADRLALSRREMARILGLSERTLQRQQPDARLSAGASERLLQLVLLYERGEDVFEDIEKFKRWMRRPLRVLYDKAPLDWLDTAIGFRMVEDELIRIEDFVIA